MEIVWDEPKRLANIDKHGHDFAELDVTFFAAAVVLQARKPRFQAISVHFGKLVSVIFRPLGREAISVISMRPANARERRIFNEQAQAN